jgi:hypothetical protein
LEYHTYPLPDTFQTQLVLKGIPPNVSEEEIREAVAALDIQTVKILQITKTDTSTRKILTRYPVFVVTFTPGTDVRKVLQISKLCHCIIRWEKYKNSRPVRQCYNCQAFGHSSNFCGKSSRCVKCDQQHATEDCTKPTGSPPKCTNCGGPHPANFSGCPQYLQQIQFQQQNNRRPQQSTLSVKPTTTPFNYQQTQFPVLKSPAPTISQQSTWAQVTSRTTQPQTAQPISSMADTIKYLLALFDYQKLCIQLRLLVTQLQTSTDPITKLVAIIDTFVTCFSTSNHP